MADAVANFSYSLVATAPSPATSGTSLIVTAATGTVFPTTPFNAVIWATGANPTAANAEIVTVTAVSTDTLTIVRAQEGSVARTVVIGDQIAAAITAKDLTDLASPNVIGNNIQVQAGYTEMVMRKMKINSGIIAKIGSGAYLRIL
jgi:hypothetical protein